MLCPNFGYAQPTIGHPCRVTTFLKNLEMSGNFAVVMDMSGNWPFVT